ncbi:ferritin-like domain-containing protein [soil metagenome]
MGGLGLASRVSAKGIQRVSDADVLTFALNLEYLEAEFYRMATTGRTLDGSDTRGSGNGGGTTGGAKVSFKNRSLENLAKEIADDEMDHVRFLRKALGSAAVAKPAINLDALMIGFKNDDEFIILARAFEDVGVSAYRGAAKLIQNNDYLDAAAGILATEAYHAGHLRSHAIYAQANCPKVDGKDQPPTEKNWIPTDGNGLGIGRTPAEVLTIVRGKSMDGGAFFPHGLNGNVK